MFGTPPSKSSAGQQLAGAPQEVKKCQTDQFNSVSSCGADRPSAFLSTRIPVRPIGTRQLAHV